MKIHIVQSGDSLYEIAKSYGVELKDLEKSNPQIKDVNKISPGMKINIPSEKKIIIQEGGSKAERREPELKINRKEMPIQEAPAPKDETPIPVKEMPVPVEEAPAPVAEAPRPVKEAPAPKYGSPIPVKEIPVPVEETPAPAAEAPRPVKEAPAPKYGRPIPVKEIPVPVEETPAPAAEAPRLVKETPAPQRETPILVKEYPVPKYEVPRLVREAPAPGRVVPTPFDQPPMPLNEAPLFPINNVEKNIQFNARIEIPRKEQKEKEVKHAKEDIWDYFRRPIGQEIEPSTYERKQPKQPQYVAHCAYCCQPLPEGYDHQSYFPHPEHIVPPQAQIKEARPRQVEEENIYKKQLASKNRGSKQNQDRHAKGNNMRCDCCGNV